MGGSKPATTGWCGASAATATPPPKNAPSSPSPTPLPLIIWHMLATGTPYTGLGADFYTRRTDPADQAQRLIAKLEALGHKVTLEPAA